MRVRVWLRVRVRGGVRVGRRVWVRISVRVSVRVRARFRRGRFWEEQWTLVFAMLSTFVACLKSPNRAEFVDCFL